MKILVTGGAGFIGSNITDALLNQGHSVRVLDNFSSGKEENLKFAQTFARTGTVPEGAEGTAGACPQLLNKGAPQGPVPELLSKPQRLSLKETKESVSEETVEN